MIPRVIGHASVEDGEGVVTEAYGAFASTRAIDWSESGIPISPYIVLHRPINYLMATCWSTTKDCERTYGFYECVVGYINVLQFVQPFTCRIPRRYYF